MAKAAELLIYEERSGAPGNRTPLVKVVIVKPLVTYLIFHLSVTHIGRTEERQMASIKQMRGGFFSLFFIRDKPRID
jgi:hypothetical protein